LSDGVAQWIERQFAELNVGGSSPLTVAFLFLALGIIVTSLQPTTCSIAIDIGGTNTRIGLFESISSPQFTLLAKFPTQQGYEQQLHHIFDSIEGSIDSANAIVGIGISIAGRITKDGCSVILAPNLPSYIGRPFAQDIADRFICPVRLAHDAVCGLLAEKKFGAIATVERCAFLTVSTGTGAAIQLAKGQLSLTSSIEIGHQILDGNLRMCVCGQIGCLETYTGGRQLEMRYGRPLAEISDPAFWDTFCTKLALGLINLAMLARIDAIAVSGAIMLNKPQLLTQVQQHIDHLDKWSSLTLVFAKLGADAPLVGAAVLLEVPEETILH
jgi:glucokinase